jgi:hypothetical protein
VLSSCVTARLVAGSRPSQYFREKQAMNCVMGDSGRKFGAGCLRRIQTNLLTDLETFELWELDHPISKTVQIILPVDYAFEYLRLSKSESLCWEEAAFQNIWRLLTLNFLITLIVF